MKKYIIVILIISVAYIVTLVNEKNTAYEFQQLLAKEGRVVTFDQVTQETKDISISDVQETEEEWKEPERIEIDFPAGVLGMITNDPKANDFMGELEQLTYGALGTIKELAQEEKLSGYRITTLLSQRQESINDRFFANNVYNQVSNNKAASSFARRLMGMAG